MSKRNPKPDLDPKRCTYCHALISSRRALVLLTTADSKIVGPFHAGCAERLRLEAERRPESNWLKGATEYGRVLPAREETLPW